MSGRIPIRATASVLLLSFFAMIGLVAKSPDKFLYDEPYFAVLALLLRQDGFTPKFLNALNAAPGPLCAVVQTIFEPVTHLRPVGMRFVNVFLLVLLVLVLTSWLKSEGEHFWIAGLSVLVVPMTWVVSGMALSRNIGDALSSR